jgi:hypothetical protein
MITISVSEYTANKLLQEENRLLREEIALLKQGRDSNTSSLGTHILCRQYPASGNKYPQFPPKDIFGMGDGKPKI